MKIVSILLSTIVLFYICGASLSGCLLLGQLGIGWNQSIFFLGWVEPISRLVRGTGLSHVFCLVGDKLDVGSD